MAREQGQRTAGLELHPARVRRILHNFQGGFEQWNQPIRVRSVQGHHRLAVSGSLCVLLRKVCHSVKWISDANVSSEECGSCDSDGFSSSPSSVVDWNHISKLVNGASVVNWTTPDPCLVFSESDSKLYTKL